MNQRPGSQQPPPSVMFFISHAAGGVMEVMDSLAAGLADHGHACRKVALYPQSAALGGKADADWDFLIDRKPRNPLLLLRALWHMAGVMRRDKPSVAISAMQFANVLLPVMARLFSPRTHVIITHHSPADSLPPLFARLDAQVGGMRNVGAIICVAPCVERSLSDRSPAYRAKCHVIGNALPPAVEQQIDALTVQHAARPAGRMIGMVGRLSSLKNPEVVIRALASVPDARLRLIGDGPDRAQIMQLAVDLGVADRVDFLGQRDRTEALRLLAEADIFAQMSRFEGHSLALIEAARLGLPLILSDVEGQRDAITLPGGMVQGRLIGCDDDAGVASAITELLDDPAVMADARAASRALAARCDFASMLDNYRKKILEVAANPH